MKPNIEDYIHPKGIYTGTQVIELTGISSRSFYRYVKQEKIPKHKRAIDSKTVFLGHEIIKALTTLKDVIPTVFFVAPKRGRPRKIQGNP